MMSKWRRWKTAKRYTNWHLFRGGVVSLCGKRIPVGAEVQEGDRKRDSLALCVHCRKKR